MNEMKEAIQKAVDAVAVAAHEVEDVDTTTKAAFRDGELFEEAQDHLREVALSLSVAAGGLLELRELLEKTESAVADSGWWR